MFDIQIVKGAELSGGALITAFPSVGMVGSIAGSYIAESLKMERVGYVLSEDVPPAALVQEGVPSYPFRILSHKKLAIMTAEFQIPLVLAGQLAKSTLEWASSAGFEMVVCLEGLMSGKEPTAVAEKDLRVFGVGSTKKSRDLLSQAGIEQFQVGMITGVSGALLSEGERLSRDVICLLVEANAMYPDARGAAKLVEAVDKLLPTIEIDLKELYEEAERIEENVKATVERTRELLAAKQGQVERLGKSYMYG